MSSELSDGVPAGPAHFHGVDVYLYSVHRYTLYIYIYIHYQRERERERERYIYIHIHDIYTHTNKQTNMYIGKLLCTLCDHFV